ncbi:MAG: signal peptide peptidase SppA [Planctomycetes bacterium]|nr:signal peptide peptidase SppA [Planctomycetota bacterium]MCB9883953.1 signal peptide peptidase SppA [Planctomycetota bacterium]
MSFAVRPLFLIAAAAIAALSPAQEATEKAPADAAPAAAAKQRVPFLRPSGTYADLPEMAFGPMDLLGGGGSPPKGFYPFVELVDGLAKVPETEVLLDLSGNPGFNLPQIRELERAFARVRAAGKKVVCYIENAGASTMQLAALADEVLMADMGVVDLRSPAMSVMHMKDALDLLGVQVEVTRVGEYKGAVEPYMLPAMSEHLRQHYEAMLRSINADVVRRIAAGRKLTEATVRQLQADRVFTANAAKAAGLVDRLVPWAGAERGLALVRGDEEFELVDAAPKKKKQSRDLMSILSSMMRGSREEEVEDPQVVVMHLAGQIVDGDKPSPGSMVSGVVVEKLDELAANELVKGVVVRINSPGGSATASEAIRLALQRLAAKKPLVFSMGSVAASGGYWITTIGQPILAEVATITGSIGVFSMRFQPGALMRRLGVHTDIVRLDDGALLDAIDRPWSEPAKARVQGIVDDIYDRFLANVAGSRHMTRDGVDKIAGGRVWSGSQAVELGLVDEIGGVEDAVAMVRKKAGLADDVEVVHMPQPKSFADAILASMFESQVAAGLDAQLLRSVLDRARQFPAVLAVLRDALGTEAGPRVYALVPSGLRID